MAKNFPYFKFMATDWLAGDIVFQDFEVQGFFINVCALYWQKDGVLTFEDVEKRYDRPDLLTKLEGKFFTKSKRGNITIKFLDEQLLHAGIISKKNSEKGKKSAAAKAAKTGQISTAVEPQLTGVQPNSTNKNKRKNKSKEELEKEKEEEKRLMGERKLSFASTLEPYLEIYGREMLKEFYGYWGEPNKTHTKFRQELEKTWDVERRLETWARKDKNFKPPDHKKPNFNEHLQKANEAREQSDEMIKNYVASKQQ